MASNLCAFFSSLHPPYKGGTLGCLHFTEAKWFAQTLPTSQWRSRNLSPEWLCHTPKHPPGDAAHVCRKRDPSTEEVSNREKPPVTSSHQMATEPSPPNDPSPQAPTGAHLRQKEALGTSEPSLPCSLLISTSSLPYSEELHEPLFQQEEKVPSHES